MDQTFITIHDLSPDANVLFASESITDILGYHPLEVQTKSCFDYFHHEEVSFARFVHSRCVLLDKAAVLHYARLRSRDGRWVTCECCFTIVYDVLVASTGIYRRGEKSERRAIEAPQISRTFSCSPDDPRHQFLEYLSFKMGGAGEVQVEREPRAALILNRFTRSLDIMFATNAVASILGITPEEIQDKSFYEFIQESCLDDAVNRLENAKAKDSIAYMRFWSRDPRLQGHPEEEGEDGENEDQNECRNEDSCPGKPKIGSGESDSDNSDLLHGMGKQNGPHFSADVHAGLQEHLVATVTMNSVSSPHTSSEGDVARMTEFSSKRHARTVFRASPSQKAYHDGWGRHPVPSVELEAVVSCTSDGLVVVLRRARPQPKIPHHHTHPIDHEDTIITGSWRQGPVRSCCPQESSCIHRQPPPHEFVSLHTSSTPADQLMRSIRDVAVFAQALVRINGNVATQSLGQVAEAVKTPREPCCCGSHLDAGPSQGSPSDRSAEESTRHEGNDVFHGDIDSHMADFSTITRGIGCTVLSGQEDDALKRS